MIGEFLADFSVNAIYGYVVYVIAMMGVFGLIVVANSVILHFCPPSPEEKEEHLN